MSRVTLSPPLFSAIVDIAVKQALNELFERVGEGPFLLQGYTVAGLPSAADWADTTSGNEFSSLVFVSDETGGATLAFSDGTNWLRVQDRVIVS